MFGFVEVFLIEVEARVDVLCAFVLCDSELASLWFDDALIGVFDFVVGIVWHALMVIVGDACILEMWLLLVSGCGLRCALVDVELLFEVFKVEV